MEIEEYTFKLTVGCRKDSIRTGLVPDFPLESNKRKTLTRKGILGGVKTALIYDAACPVCSTTVPYLAEV